MHRGTPEFDEQQRLAAGFGATIRAERNRLGGMTQAELAERAHVCRNTVQALENGKRRPTENMTWKLAKALRTAELDRVALDVRLQVLAGDSLVRLSKRTKLRRERLAAEIIAEGGPALPHDAGEAFDAYLATLLGVSA